jgi:hypothetical protein
MPSLAPHFGAAEYVVLDDFRKAGRVYRATAEGEATLAVY